MGATVRKDSFRNSFLTIQAFPKIFFAEAIVAIIFFKFSEVIFRDPPNIPFKTSIEMTSRGYFLFFEVMFCLARFCSKKIASNILRVDDIFAVVSRSFQARRRHINF